VPAATYSPGTTPSQSSLSTHLALAAAGLLIFLSLFLTSGRVVAGDGLGWDGRGYASLMTDGLDEGSVITRSRPFLPLITRIPHALGLDVIQSFQVMNAIYAFTLYLFVALILDRYGASTRFKLVVIANLALCIATSKMFAYYPVLVDLGGLALMTAAFYFTITDRHALAGATCVLGVASREFAIAAALCGWSRTYCQGRLWRDGWWYLPAVVVAITVRVVTYAEGSLSLRDVIMNLGFWRSPMYVTAFFYFAITVFGGVSAFLAVHPRWCARRLREHPEQATFFAVVVGLAAVGNLDIWRYLMFTLPVVVALTGQYYCDHLRGTRLEQPIAAAMLFTTVMTQRPFQGMNGAIYFREWFPQYDFVSGLASPELLILWGTRLTGLMLLIVLLASISRSPGLQGSES
jgi:hypothetical protein